MSEANRIAIVGLGAIFPESPAPELLWNNVVRGVDTAREPPPGRWLLDPADAYDPRIPAPDKVYSKHGCFIEDFTLDPAGLDIDPDLVEELDPMFHLALHAGREAWRDAVTSAVDRSRVGVILGNIVLPTKKASALAREYLLEAFVKSGQWSVVRSQQSEVRGQRSGVRRMASRPRFIG